jgi:hypothetical protein
VLEETLQDASDLPWQRCESRFTDGTTRPVFEDRDGRQYVVDDGERIYGMWILPADERLFSRRGLAAV